MQHKYNRKLHKKSGRNKPIIYDGKDRNNEWDINDGLDNPDTNSSSEQTKPEQTQPKELEQVQSNEKPVGKNNKQKLVDKTFIQALSFFSQVGITMAACVFIGVFFGRFLDAQFGTAPWLLLAFSLIGVMAAIKALFDLADKK